MALIVLADIILVFGTSLMEAAANKIQRLQLPLLIVVPTFPSAGGYVALGLGDIFFRAFSYCDGEKMGKKAAMLCIFSISATFLVGETILLNSNVGPFPATVLIVIGWSAYLAMQRLAKATSSRTVRVSMLKREGD